MRTKNAANRVDGFTVFSYIIVTLFMIAVLIPFWNVLVISLTSSAEYIQTPILIFLKHPTFSAYRTMLGDKRLLIGYSTTLKILLIGLPINILLTVTMSYALSRRSYPGKKFFLYFVMFTMFFSGGIIPLYLLVKELSLTNTIWAVILPGALNTFYMIITRNFFQSLPAALEESAEIDGAGNLTILFRIYLPLAMPILDDRPFLCGGPVERVVLGHDFYPHTHFNAAAAGTAIHRD